MRRLSISIALLALLTAAAVAHAELEQSGNLRLRIDGGFKPRALPRDKPAPVRATLEASITTVDGFGRRSCAASPSRSIATASSTRGLPTCDAGELEATTSKVALERCGNARVGHGRFGANVDFPNRPPIPVEGKMLAFNARVDGRPGLLLHINGSNPVQATFVLPFKISHPKAGKFGTVFATVIPRIASDLGYVTDVKLTFGRRYRFKGKSMSFLSASCAAPAGFPGALFSFVRASFGFATGRQLTTTLSRDCVAI